MQSFLRMIKSRCILFLEMRNYTLVGLIIIALASFLVAMSEKSLTAQQPDRFIEKKSAPREPVRIMLVKNQKGSLKVDTRFPDDEEWLKGFSVEVINIYHKRIRYISLELLFPRPDGQTEPPVATSLTYGEDPSNPIESPKKSKLIDPGRRIILTLTDLDYESIREILKTQKYDQPIKRVRLRLEDVLFEDGTKWVAGMFFKPDEENLNKWVPIENANPKLHHPVRSPPLPRLFDNTGWIAGIPTPMLTLTRNLSLDPPCDGHWDRSEWQSCLDAGCNATAMGRSAPVIQSFMSCVCGRIQITTVSRNLLNCILWRNLVWRHST